MPARTPLRVAVGVLLHPSDDRVLVARRPRHVHQGGLWEFPGGKVEAGELGEVALARECLEELGVEIRGARPLIQITHDYPDRRVQLEVWQVLDFDGEPVGREGQEVCWLAAAEIARLPFPAANEAIVERVLKLLQGEIAPTPSVRTH